MATRITGFVESKFDSGPVVLNYGEGPANGAPLIVVHGGSYRWQTEGVYLERLKARWHILAVDLRGHGASGRTPGHYRILDYAADLDRFIDAKVGGPYAYMGWSLGALVGIGLASVRPRNLTSLILRDPVWSRLDDKDFREGVRSQQQNLGSIVVDESSISDLLSRRPDLPREAAAERLEARSKADPAFMTPLIDGTLLDGLDYAAALRSIVAPSLIIQADDAAGGGLPDEDARRIKSEMSDVEVVKFLGYGHDLDLHRPAGPFDVIAGFLARTDVPRSHA